MEKLTAEEGRLAIGLARGIIEYTIAKKPRPMITLTPVFHEKRGVFVTLTKDGTLRGCIGFPYPVMPLGDAIEHAAVAAALEDPRFPQVRKDEIAGLALEVTVLSVPEPLTCESEDRPAHVIVGRHGLVVRGMGTSGLLLPQVATDYHWDSRTFLDHTCEKAGLPAHSWMKKTVEVLTFEGQIFSEQENR